MGFRSVLPLIAMLPLVALRAAAEPAPGALVVCPACELRTVRAGVAAAAPGGTVIVEAGTYPEHGIVIDKPLRLIARGRLERDGRPRPVIDGRGEGTVIFVRAAGVEVSGFELRRSGVSHVDERAGIKIGDSRDCRITDNVVTENQFGVYLGRTQSCLVAGNVVRGTGMGEGSSGNGIHLWSAEGITVEKNDVSGHRDGLYFEFAKKSVVRSNISRGNLRYGLHFMFSNHNEYRGNVFAENGSGVAVMYSKSILMAGNRFEGSRGPAAYGLLLKDISDSFIGANRFAGNTVGAYLEGTSRSEFRGNTFRGNGWALRVLGDCDSNTIAGNDFLDNTFDVGTNATANANVIAGNHWGRYRGLDLDGDGIGDDPYLPVPLSALLMERFGATVLLINSFFFMVLDEIENVLPALAPESFRDAKPAMRRMTADD